MSISPLVPTSWSILLTTRPIRTMPLMRRNRASSSRHHWYKCRRQSSTRLWFWCLARRLTSLKKSTGLANSIRFWLVWASYRLTKKAFLVWKQKVVELVSSLTSNEQFPWPNSRTRSAIGASTLTTISITSSLKKSDSTNKKRLWASSIIRWRITTTTTINPEYPLDSLCLLSSTSLGTRGNYSGYS